MAAPPNTASASNSECAPKSPNSSFAPNGPKWIDPKVVLFREQLRASWGDGFYSGRLHFWGVSVVALSLIAVAIFQVSEPSWQEIAIAPATFLWANCAEYMGHRGPMHHKRGWNDAVFRRHTLEHHHFFTHQTMACESTRDYKIMLFPPILGVFFIVVFALPVGGAIGLLLGKNAALIYFATAVGYFITYEWLHFSYHLPPESWISKIPAMGALRRHHMNHHDQALMTNYNFNITFPIFDAVMGTRYRGAKANRQNAPSN